MLRIFRIGWLALGLAFLGADAARGQTLPPAAPAPTIVPMPSRPMFTYPELSPPVRMPPSTMDDRNGSILIGDPLLDGTGTLGWFATAEINLVRPYVSNLLNNTVTTPAGMDQVALPSADLGGTVSPRFELGYRFGQASGEFIVSYRFLNSTGSGTLPGADGAGNPGFDSAGNPAALRSRLSMNIVDLDYGSKETSLVPFFDMKWRAGARIASLLFDSQAISPLLEQSESNQYLGVGPHVSLELGRTVVTDRLGIYCKLEGAGVVGNVRQRFEETIANAGAPIGGLTAQSQYMPSYTLGLQAGVTWTPSADTRLMVGYVNEQWGDAAFANNASNYQQFSHGSVRVEGGFVRFEWRY